MGRLARDSRLETREARARLAERHEPYWRQVHEGLFVGYRKGSRGGKWIARRFAGAGRYEKKTLGIADDRVDADDESGVLDYRRAHELAVEFWKQSGERRRDTTVGAALDTYLGWYRRHRKAVSQTEYVINAHIRPEFGERKVDELKAGEIRTWHQSLAEKRTKATANRILTVLKAAMNRAWEDGDVRSRDAWTRVKPFKGAEQAKVRYLERDQCLRLINACEGSFRDLVRGALLTGCRYGEIRELRVSDYDTDTDSVLVRDSKSGAARYVPLSDEGVALVESRTAGQPAGAHIFRQDDGKPWKNYLQVRRIREASERAGIDPPANFHCLRHTYASLLVQAGTELYVVSKALGHADLRVTSKHYAHLAPSHIAEAIRARLPKLELQPQSRKVRRIRAKR